ncbi:MAG: lamin tail domain-containing protein [Methanobacteriota archaeon]|nr:MAG: lamin tail domain-containing protein [Euryarchaeota archaeon]
MTASIVSLTALASSASSSDVAPSNDDVSPPLLIVEFYAAGVADDEYVVISNSGSCELDLQGWSITDGEGAIMFGDSPPLQGGGTASVSFNSSSFFSAFGRLPDYSVDGLCPCEQAEVLGSFRLADEGDSIALVDPCGVEVDYVVYGDAVPDYENWAGFALPHPRRGEVLRRIAGSEDTDSACDWLHFREFKYGYSEHRPMTCRIDPGCMIAFVSPDCSLRAVLDQITAAEESIRLCAYELDSPAILNALMDARNRAVKVRVLVDSSPVGGMSSDQMAGLSVMATQGVEVILIKGDLREGAVKHFSALHSKYMVIDDETLIVLSENFVSDGLPRNEVFGNRGWGAAVKCPELALCAAAIFDDDSRRDRSDVFDWLADERFAKDSLAPIESDATSIKGMLTPLTSNFSADATLFVSPDCSLMSPFLCGLIDEAFDIQIQQFQVDLHWDVPDRSSTSLNPMLQHLLDRLRMGASCRMLLDSSWFNIEGNGEVVSSLGAVTSVERLDGAYRMMNERSPISVMHNKGLLLDGLVCVVSSNNWVFSSLAKNREFALAIRSAEAAEYFARAFELDWNPDTSAPTLEAPVDISVASGEWVRLSLECFSDDRHIVEGLWDVGCDGTIDARADELSFLAVVPGVVEIELTVIDAWGNMAAAVIVVRVIATPASALQGPSPHPLVGLALPPMTIAVCYLTYRRLRMHPGNRR